MIASARLNGEYSIDIMLGKNSANVGIRDADGNLIYLNFKTYQQAHTFVCDLEQSLANEYSEQFELLHDEF